MNKYGLVFAIMMMCTGVNAHQSTDNNRALSSICVRPAQLEDLEETLALDWRVTFEFFKPLYMNAYAQYEFGKNPDPFLEGELAADQEFFLQAIMGQVPERLYIAIDNQTNAIIGLLVFHAQETVLHLDLLLVDTQYRKQGVGRKLIARMIEDSPVATACVVYPWRFGNDATLSFYEALGFVNQGIPQFDKINAYGVPYNQVYLHYVLPLRKNISSTNYHRTRDYRALHCA